MAGVGGKASHKPVSGLPHRLFQAVLGQVAMRLVRSFHYWWSMPRALPATWTVLWLEHEVPLSEKLL